MAAVCAIKIVWAGRISAVKAVQGKQVRTSLPKVTRRAKVVAVAEVIFKMLMMLGLLET